jgi:integrase
MDPLEAGMTRAKATPKRRRNGEGGLFRRSARDARVKVKKPDGTVETRTRHVPERWYYQRMVNGRQVTISGRTEAEVLARRDEIDAPAKAGRDVSADKRKLTVETVLNRWLADYEAQMKAGEKAPNTLRTYRLLVRNHIVPALGRLHVRTLTTQDVNRWLTGLDLADSTRRKCRAVLVTALAWGETAELVGRNVARTSKVTSRERVTESAFLTAQECQRLREAIKGDRLEALYLLILGSGLRRGEALGLAWSDVDFAAGTVRVRRSLTEMPGGKPVLGQPKTGSSARVARVLPFALDALRRHWESLTVVPMDLSEALVFLSTTGTPIFPNNLTRDFAIVTRRAGLGARHVHELRHAYAAEMLRRGVPLHVVSRQLGHASVAITADIYGHIQPTESDALLAAGETAFSEVGNVMR